MLPLGTLPLQHEYLRPVQSTLTIATLSDVPWYATRLTLRKLLSAGQDNRIWCAVPQDTFVAKVRSEKTAS